MIVAKIILCNSLNYIHENPNKKLIFALKKSVFELMQNQVEQSTSLVSKSLPIKPQILVTH